MWERGTRLRVNIRAQHRIVGKERMASSGGSEKEDRYEEFEKGPVCKARGTSDQG
jgi:hypothetical protein